MPPKINMIGRKFGRLMVLSDNNIRQNKRIMWLCICDCGVQLYVRGDHLQQKATQSCGCTKGDSHNMSKTKTYITWCNMISRCVNPNNKHYKNYGDRGIKVCPRWLNSFTNFFKDMGKHPTNMFIDRKNNNKGYSPSNCRWVTRKQNQRNMRNNRNITFNGKTQCLTDWAEELNINMGTLYARLTTYGWSIERALTTPIRR